jgi:hypothetical protein
MCLSMGEHPKDCDCSFCNVIRETFSQVAATPEINHGPGDDDSHILWRAINISQDPHAKRWPL